MPEQVVFIGTYAIADVGFEDWSAANEAMCRFVQANEPKIISWHTYVNAEHTEATTIMVFPDSAALEYHMQVAASRIGVGVQMVRTSKVELYGQVSDALVAQLWRVSEMSGSWPVIVKEHLRGFPD